MRHMQVFRSFWNSAEQKERGNQRRRWHFQTRERGVFSVGPVWTHIAFCCFRLLQSYWGSTFPVVSAGLAVELGLSNRGIPHFVAIQALSPWAEDQGGPQDRPQCFSALQANAGEAESWFLEFAWLSTPFHPGVLLENQTPRKERSNFKGLFSYMRSVPFPLRKPSILPCNKILERDIALPCKNCISPGIRMPCLSFKQLWGHISPLIRSDTMSAPLRWSPPRPGLVLELCSYHCGHSPRLIWG